MLTFEDGFWFTCGAITSVIFTLLAAVIVLFAIGGIIRMVKYVFE